MKRKIAYLTITAVIGVTAFFVGKNFSEPTQQLKNVNLERIEMTEQYGGIWLDYTDGNNFYSFYLTSEDLENTGYIKESITPDSQEITDLTVTEYGLMVTFGDDTGVWIESEDLEHAGLISTANIVDWNTNGEGLAVMTENDYEYYAYKSANIYQNRAFLPVESVVEK